LNITSRHNRCQGNIDRAVLYLIIYLMAVDVRVREKIDANFALPGSKSIGARALLLSALAEGS